MTDHVEAQLFLETLIRVGTPLLLAALGEAILERAGMLNIGIEGTMLGGAFCGFAVAWSSGSPVAGALASMLAGMVLSSILATMTLRFKADQIVVGMSLNLLSFGVTGTAFKALESLYARQGGGVMQVQTFTALLPGLENVPLLSAILFKQTLLTWVAIALIPLVWWYLQKTERGLELRATGENPAAAAASGIDVFATRWKACLAAGALAGLGGGFLTLSQAATFSPNCTAGRGFIALAAVVLGRYSIAGTAAACLFFGAAFTLRDRLQVRGAWIPPELLELLPYVLTLLALSLALQKRSTAPAALGKPLA